MKTNYRRETTDAKRRSRWRLATVALVLVACNERDVEFDASGTFEAVETIISAEAAGKIMAFTIREGEQLKAGQVVGYVDTVELHLQRLQLEQNRKAVLSGRPRITAQTQALREQLSTARRERERMSNLVEGGVATKKQLDDATAQVATLEAQIAGMESTLNTTTSSINEQGSMVDVQLQQIREKLRKAVIINPVNGTVLTKYAEPFEITSPGKPLYRIADLSFITLRAYITGEQLARVRLNDKIKVFTDDGRDKFREATGTVMWISDKAEFTPKSVHTKDERSNLVYAVRIGVPNDGTYKIGMYGEIRFK